jgi:trk system potassium uptake protein TrkA
MDPMRLGPGARRTRIRPVKVIIVGCGRVGAHLALQLDREGNDVTVVDQHVAAFGRLAADFGGQMVVGNGIDEAVLRRAGIEHADCFCSVTSGDNRNIMSAQIAKVIFNVPRVITRIYDPNRELAYREMGLETLCSTTIGANLIHDYFLDGNNRSHAPREAAAEATS